MAAAVLVAACLGPSGEGDPSLRHDFSYEVSVAVDRPIDDLVLRVPLPSVNGSSDLGEALANGMGYGVRPGWTVAIVEVNGTPLLELRAARFLPEYRGTPIAIAPGGEVPPATFRSESNPVLMPYSLGVSIAVNRTIETRDPSGREPLLGGGAGLVSEGCSLPGQGTGVRWYRHPVEGFAEYRAAAPANVTVGVQLTGSNQWWRGGWTFNQYTDSVLVEFTEGRRGWATPDAVLTAGEGIYP